MKTKTFSIIAFTVLALGVGSVAKAANGNKEVATELTHVNKINKIEVYGNVEVFVSNGNDDKVKVYNHYYAEDALVQNTNGVLRISSYKAEKLVVWVTAKDLEKISAYDNAEVRSFGKLSETDLNVDLHNHAYANLDLNTISTNLSIADQAKADLSGSAINYDLQYGRSTTVNQSSFAAESITKVMKGGSAQVSEDELAGL